MWDDSLSDHYLTGAAQQVDSETVQQILRNLAPHFQLPVCARAKKNSHFFPRDYWQIHENEVDHLITSPTTRISAPDTLVSGFSNYWDPRKCGYNIASGERSNYAVVCEVRLVVHIIHEAPKRV